VRFAVDEEDDAALSKVKSLDEANITLIWEFSF
jgi:hypothetical protein